MISDQHIADLNSTADCVCCACPYPLANEPVCAIQGRVATDIVLLVDGANNINNGLFNSIKSLLSGVVDTLMLDFDEVAVAVAEYSEDFTRVSSFETNSDDIQASVARLTKSGGFTSNLGPALLSSVSLLHNEGRAGANKVLFVLTNNPHQGTESSYNQAVARLDGLRFSSEQQFTGVALSFGRNADQGQLLQITGERDMNALQHTYFNPSLSVDLTSRLSNSLMTVCTTEENCHLPPQLDALFLVDVANPIGTNALRQLRNFVASSSATLLASPDLDNRVGLATFADDFVLEDMLSSNQVSSSYTARAGPRNTGRALDAAIDYLNANGRPDVNGQQLQGHMIVLVQRGPANPDNLAEMNDAVKRIERSRDLEVVVVQYGAQDDPDSERIVEGELSQILQLTPGGASTQVITSTAEGVCYNIGKFSLLPCLLTLSSTPMRVFDHSFNQPKHQSIHKSIHVTQYISDHEPFNVSFHITDNFTVNISIYKPKY